MIITNSKLSGNLIIIGGAEDKEGKKEILTKVCECINKDIDKLLIATIATEYPEAAENKYRKVFSELGVKNIDVLRIQTREEALMNENSQKILDAKLIFFTGGDQLRITSLLGGTKAYDLLKEVASKGCYIVGTSAGASVMSDTMILEGKDEEAPKKSSLKMAPGLGLIRNIIIDQHFEQRGRIGRLITGISQNPQVLGIGIDENTAIIVNNNYVEVIGEAAVYFIDASEMTYTDVSEQNYNEVLSLFNLKLHVLKSGDKFDLLKKQPFEESENIR